MELLLLFGLCTVIFSNKKVVVVVCLWWWRTSLGLIVLFSCFKLLFVRWLVCFWLFCVMFHEGFFGVRSFAGLKFRSREFRIGEMIPPKIWCLNFRAIKEKKGVSTRNNFQTNIDTHNDKHTEQPSSHSQQQSSSQSNKHALGR